MNHVWQVIIAIGVAIMAGNLPHQHNSGVSTATVNAMVEVYESASEELLKHLRVALESASGGEQFRRARAAMLLKRIDDTMAKFGNSIQPAIERASIDSYQRGMSEGRAMLRDMGLTDDRLRQRPTFAAVDERAVQVLANDIAIASVKAMDDLAQNAKRLTRAIAFKGIEDTDVSKVLAKGIVTGDVRQAKREVRELFRNPNLEESYRKLGNRLINVGDATMSVRQYSNMLMRTRTREAVVKARVSQFIENDVRLGIIDGRVSKNFCTRYIGLIVSLDGNHPKWPALSSLPGGGPPFHPKCSKSVRPYVESLAPASVASKGERALAEFKDHGTSRDPLDPHERSAARGRI